MPNPFDAGLGMNASAITIPILAANRPHATSRHHANALKSRHFDASGPLARASSGEPATTTERRHMASGKRG